MAIWGGSATQNKIFWVLALGVAKPPLVTLRVTPPPTCPWGWATPHGSDGVTGHPYYFIKVFNFLLFLFLFSFLKLNNI
jgi:hypothetical protein